MCRGSSAISIGLLYFKKLPNECPTCGKLIAMNFVVCLKQFCQTGKPVVERYLRKHYQTGRKSACHHAETVRHRGADVCTFCGGK